MTSIAWLSSLQDINIMLHVLALEDEICVTANLNSFYFNLYINIYTLSIYLIFASATDRILLTVYAYTLLLLPAGYPTFLTFLFALFTLMNCQ